MIFDMIHHLFSRRSEYNIIKFNSVTRWLPSKMIAWMSILHFTPPLSSFKDLLDDFWIIPLFDNVQKLLLKKRTLQQRRSLTHEFFHISRLSGAILKRHYTTSITISSISITVIILIPITVRLNTVVIIRLARSSRSCVAIIIIWWSPKQTRD